MVVTLFLLVDYRLEHAMEHTQKISENSVVLVSGGGKGITAQSAIKLAKNFKCKFILIGRSSIDEREPDWAVGCLDESELKRKIMEHLSQINEKPTPKTIQSKFNAILSYREISKTLEEISGAGGKAVYVSTDISDLEMLKTKLAGPIAQMGPVTGIIHGAGALADKLIEKKSNADFERVYNPKIKGLQNLLACVDVNQLDFLILYSSVAGFYGNIGQSDYALANEILNKTAYSFKSEHPDCRVLSINWGPWESGMVTPELKKHFETQNIPLIGIDEGTNILVNALLSKRDPSIEMVVGGSLSRPPEVFTSELRKHRISRMLTLESNPFLLDHMIGDNPVLPATCATAWLAHSAEQFYPGYIFTAMENFQVLKGIVFDNNLADRYFLDLEEIEKSDRNGIEVKVVISSLNNNGKPFFHYQSVVHLSSQTNPPNLSEEIIFNIENRIPGKVFYDQKILFHGPAFQGIDQVFSVKETGVQMQVNLPNLPLRYQGQFPVIKINPYINDSIVQCLLIWSYEHYQAPCLPSQLKRLDLYRSIPFDTPCLVDMKITNHNPSNVTADLVVVDSNGAPYLKFTGLEGTISPHLNKIIGPNSK
jgi:NAD(P)-dependent dehydrogenase (short-subunit alcohol dehydrogenase family)